MSTAIGFLCGLSVASFVIADRHGLPRRWMRRWVAYTWNREEKPSGQHGARLGQVACSCGAVLTINLDALPVLPRYDGGAQR